MIPAGARDRLIEFQRPTYVRNELNENVEGVPEIIARAWARIRFGTGQERREAAQERASMTATFECLWTPILATVVETDRIVAFDKDWDVISAAPIGVNRELHFTAVSSS